MIATTKTQQLAAWIPIIGLYFELMNEEHYMSDRSKPGRYIAGIFYHVACFLLVIKLYT
jgi:hypothetical protein